MTNKEVVDRNIGLTFDFLRQAVKDPAMLDSIPDDSVIEFVDKDFTKKETKSAVKPDRFLRVKSVFELLSPPRPHLT